MKDEREKRIRELKEYMILFVLLWILVIFAASSISYARHVNGTASLYDAVEAIGHFRLYYWLNPVTWGSCLKWSFIYWVGVGMFLIYQEKYHHDAAGIEAGSAHWNNAVDKYNETHTEPFGDPRFTDEPGVIKENYNNPDKKRAKPVPGNPNMILSETVRLSTADMKTHLNNNVFIVGGAGTGKSRFFIKPNVLQMNCSYVVTDPSGELLKSMHNVLKENGYKIKVMNLVDMQHSNKYNPFRYIRTATDVSILVDCFISNTTAADQKSGDPFWDKSEKALLTALIFYLVDIAGEEYQTFSTVLWMVQLAQMEESMGMRRPAPADDKKKRFSFSLDTPLDELFNGTKRIGKKTIKDKDGIEQEVLDIFDIQDAEDIKKLQDQIEGSLCLTNYKTFKLGGTKTLKSILISAAVRLNPFSIPAIRNLTEDDNVELEKVGDELTCFFAIIPQTNSTFNFLISMLFSQMFESLYFEGAKQTNSRLNYHVRFLLDEFANIGKIPEFPQKISTCRKYNISTTIVLQSIAQIKMLYKDDYETIIGNCDSAICLGTNEQTTADYFSKKLGKATITSRSKSMQVGKSGGNMSFQQTGRELMTPDEIMTMPFDECIVMLNHIAPFYDKKYPLEKHPQFSRTGDGNKDNFYSLEKDVEFLCVSNTKELACEAAKEAVGGQEEEKLMPKSLEEVLGDILLNKPEEDGYFLIRDPDEKHGKILFSAYLKKAEKATEDALAKGYKTPFFDGNYMDPALLRPLTVRLMNSGKIQDILAVCRDASGSSYNGALAAADTERNAVQAVDRLEFKRKNAEAGEGFSVWDIAGAISVEKKGKLEEACKAGADIIKVKATAENDDGELDMQNYMDF